MTWHRCFSWFVSSWILNWLLASSVTAQVVGDGTVGTQVNGSPTDPCTGFCSITNGTIRGGNLFHSFQQFSLPNGDVANFQITPATQNVIVRVTGTGQPFISNINGTIQTSTPANLFLLNPNGIAFGSRATLNIGGAFLATTANSMRFADGSELRTNDPTPLLTISVPIGLQFGRTPGAIQATGSRLLAGQTNSFGDFALVGGDVTLENSFLFAPGRRIELGGVSEAGTVGLNIAGDRQSLSFTAGISRSDVTLMRGARVNAEARPGGEIVVTGRTIALDGSEILTGILPGNNTAVTRQSGDITINATANLELTQRSIISNFVRPNATGQGGNTNIVASDILLRDASAIGTATGGNGSAGNVAVSANFISLDNSGITSQVEQLDAQGNSGNLAISTKLLRLTNGGIISAGTFGNGNGGNVRVSANTISLDGTSPDGSFSSGIASQIAGGIGRGGDITIETSSLTATNGAGVSAGTFGIGNAGNVEVTANAIVLDGATPNNRGSGIRSDIAPGGIGRGGNVTVRTNSLKVANGAAIAASTFGEGNAGNTRVVANTIVLDGTSSDGRFGSVIGSEVGLEGIGDGGDVAVEAGSLTVTNGALVSASVFGTGRGGIVQVKANSVTVDGEGGRGPSAIASQITGNGSGGSIFIDTTSFNIMNGATLSAGTFGTGDGGSVDVSARSITVMNSATIAAGTDGNGNGGQVQLTADSITLDNSGIASGVGVIGAGRGGDVNIKTNRLALNNGALISASTAGIGDAGNITVTADTIALNGSLLDSPFLSGIGSQVSETGIGRGGDVTVQTNSLTMANNVGISAAMFGTGNAGNVRVTANTIAGSKKSEISVGTSGKGNGGTVQVTGNAIALDDSAISSQVGRTGVGRGGDVIVETDLLTLTNRAVVSSSAFGNGSAGNLNINAQSVRLDQGGIFAAALSGDGANIRLDISDLLLMRRDSRISTGAGLAEAGGNGGNITINTPGGFLVTALNENNDITANAFNGSGGNVNINAQAIYGFTPRSRSELVQLLSTDDPSQLDPVRLLSNNITAISQSNPNLSGTVTLNTPDVDPDRGLIELPTEPITTQLAQGCQTQGSRATSQFIVTGRGGLPSNPEDILNSNAVQVDLVTRNPGSENLVQTQPLQGTPSESILEAQGWIRDRNGKVVLVAEAPSIAAQASGVTQAFCVPESNGGE